ncbi:hypothetical protein [Candidatus Cardinium hertigii]|uniref:Lipoprotein n=1 Tax=Candidatus Cardinium hertigii TaxID=247481 RepID=A0A3N2QC27_9BACT|nr:hypothetical protein [Candidatus Cardinium hertigii]ROT47142.1 hypothetical protein EDM02_04665 [Candidatus Cardinium hertigii]
MKHKIQTAIFLFSTLALAGCSKAANTLGMDNKNNAPSKELVLRQFNAYYSQKLQYKEEKAACVDLKRQLAVSKNKLADAEQAYKASKSTFKELTFTKQQEIKKLEIIGNAIKKKYHNANVKSQVIEKRYNTQKAELTNCLKKQLKKIEEDNLESDSDSEEILNEPHASLGRKNLKGIEQEREAQKQSICKIQEQLNVNRSMLITLNCEIQARPKSKEKQQCSKTKEAYNAAQNHYNTLVQHFKRRQMAMQSYKQAKAQYKNTLQEIDKIINEV